MNETPLRITTRVFQSDTGWSYQVQWWSGPKYADEGPTGSLESVRVYRTASAAWKAAYAHLGAMRFMEGRSAKGATS